MEITTHIEGDKIIQILNLVFPVFSIITVMFYLISACTNPGYIIGNEQIQLAKAYAFDVK